MDQSKPDERIEKLAMKVNLNISYKLGTSFIGYESLVRQRESPLNLHLVAMIIRCSFVSSSVQIMQHTISFVLFLFISQMPLRWCRKASFFSIKNCKKYYFSERNPITVGEIILKASNMVLKQKSEILNGQSHWYFELLQSVN